MSCAAEPAPSDDPSAIARMAEMIMCRGYTFQHAFRVTDEQMEAIYAWGYILQEQQQYEKASRVFQYLCYLNHYDVRGWVALGFCREKRRLYESALQAYIMAGTLAPQDPVPPLRATECLLLMGHLEPAESTAQRVVQLAGDDPRYQRRRDRAEKLLKAIHKRRNKRQSS